MELARWLPWAFAALFLAYGFWLLPVLTDWVSSAVDEGYTGYAAQRIREGQWPHRDFFFLWSPGTPLFHALLQSAGFSWLGERGATLLATLASSFLLLRWAGRWAFARLDFLLLALLLFSWSFPLWNIPYSSWYAVLFTLLGARLAPRSLWLAGIALGFSFWFKQNVGILSFLGACGWLISAKKGRELPRLAGAFLGVLSLGFLVLFLGGGKFALTQALSQIFLFPFRYRTLMGKAPPPEILAAPLTTFGLWLLSLLLLRSSASPRTGRLMQVGLMAYACAYAVKGPEDYFLGCFYLFSCLAWPLALGLELLEQPREKLPAFFLLFLPAAGAFLQIYPRLDFQHFLFVSPLALFFLSRALAMIGKRYPALPEIWVRFPLIILLAGGIFMQSQVLRTRIEGREDALGRISRGEGNSLNEEVWLVKKALHQLGLKEGDPILVLPNATGLYRWAGFRNPGPHQQFFPGYVEAYGQQQEQVLADYRASGGKFLVVQERSGLETDVPEIFRQIQSDYEVVKAFPEHFTIYEPKKRGN